MPKTKKKMTKKKILPDIDKNNPTLTVSTYSKITYLMLIIVFIAVLLLGLSHLVKNIENIPAAPTEVRIADFESAEEGTFNGQLLPTYFKDPIDPVIVLFASAKVPGISFIYYPYDSKLVVGSPPMSIENVKFFAGEGVLIGYIFKKDGNQYLYLDGQMVASSQFKLPESDSITGMVTGASKHAVSKGFSAVIVK